MNLVLGKLDNQVDNEDDDYGSYCKLFCIISVDQYMLS